MAKKLSTTAILTLLSIALMGVSVAKADSLMHERMMMKRHHMIMVKHHMMMKRHMMMHRSM